MQTLKVAVVGCGYVTDGHLRAWKKTPKTQVTAVVDVDETMAGRTARDWRIPQYFTSLSTLIEKSDISLVDICTPPQTHASLAVEAMKSGINVLLEKPMTMTVEDAEEIVKCEETTGVKAGVIHNWLFEPPVPEVKSLVEKGYIKVINVEVEALNTMYDPMAANEHHWCHRLPGGRFGEMLAHPIYLIRQFLGGEVEIKDIFVSKLGNYPWMKSDELCATFKSGDKFGRVYLSFNAPRQAIFLNLYGKNAIFRLDLINATVIKLWKREIDKLGIGSDSIGQATQLAKSTIKNFFKIVSGRWLNGHDMSIKLFAQSLFDNDKPPVTVKDGYEVVKILEEMSKRIETTEKKGSNTSRL